MTCIIIRTIFIVYLRNRTSKNNLHSCSDEISWVPGAFRDRYHVIMKFKATSRGRITLKAFRISLTSKRAEFEFSFRVQKEIWKIHIIIIYLRKMYSRLGSLLCNMFHPSTSENDEMMVLNNVTELWETVTHKM